METRSHYVEPPYYEKGQSYHFCAGSRIERPKTRHSQQATKAGRLKVTKTAYPARIIWDKNDGVFHVVFLDLPGCITYGENLAEAKEMAADALTGVLESMIAHDEEVPAASSNESSVDVYEIEPSKNISFVLWLRKKRKEHGLSLTDMSDKLGVAYHAYQRLEDPGKSNPTIKTIAKLELVFGERVLAV